MAKKRTRPVENPLLRDRVSAIVGEGRREQLTVPTGDVKPVQKTPPKRKTATPKKRGRDEVHIKARFSRKEAEAIERFTRTMSAYMQTKVMGSEVTRALWTLALRAEERIAEVSQKAPGMERPSYGDRMAMAEFEDGIAEFVLQVLR